MYNTIQNFLYTYSNAILAILIAILLYNTITQNILLLILITCIVFIISNQFNNVDYFDADTREFVPIGYDRHDLRGFRLRTRPMYDCINNDFNNCYNSNF